MLAAALWAAWCCSGAQQPAPSERTQPFGAAYKDLRPEQRKLFDDVVARYRDLSGEAISPERAWENQPQSVRTTYDAVTHALLATELTSEDGKPLGRAIDLIEAIDEVAGERKGESGDRQFRIYFHLKPNALEVLSQSTQLRRERDNTRFHKGYPICFRMEGTPSVQFSISEDGKRADVDVDYRSSRFPSALVNGHLSASNSDVRAGNNEQRHNSRWEGLVAWWTDLFSWARPAAPASEAGQVPSEPRKGKGKLEEAVADFFGSWMVEGKPELAIPYLSRQAYPCAEQRAAEIGEKKEPGLTRYYMYQRLKGYNSAYPPAGPLSGHISALPAWDPVLKPVRHRYEKEFLLVEVPDDLAEAFDCSHRQAQVRATKAKRDYGKHFGSAVRLRGQNGQALEMLFVWAKEGDYWRIVSYEVVEQARAGGGFQLTRARAAVAEAPVDVIQVEGDPEFIRAATAFAEQWFVRNNYESALAYLLSEAHACTAQVSEGVPRNETLEAQRQRLLNGMRQAADAMGKQRDLAAAVQAPTPVIPKLRVVRHPREAALLLMSVPDQLASLVHCGEQPKLVELRKQLGDQATYGQVYASAFQLRVSGTPAVFYALWHRADGGWRIFFWDVEVP